MADPFDPPRDQHPACVAKGCRCMPKAHCITLCVETVKMTLTPPVIGRLALNVMPACFNVTRELVVALAQKALEPAAGPDTKRLEWLFSVLNDTEIKRKVMAVSDAHAAGGMHGIRVRDWRHSMDVAMEQYVERGKDV